MNTVLILVSHGTLAEGVYSAAAMMLGETDGIRCFCLTDKDDSVSFRHKVREGIQDLADSGVLLLCDLLGGSPMTMALDELVQADITVRGVYGGLNLAMSLAAWINRDRDDVQERILQEGAASIAAMDIQEKEEEI